MRGATLATCLEIGRGSHSGLVVGKSSVESEVLGDGRSGLDGLVSKCVGVSKDKIK